MYIYICIYHIVTESELLHLLFRTHRCGEVTSEDVGTSVKLSGWLEFKRGRKFFTIRDFTGSCQVISGMDIQLPTKESVVNVEGVVQLRPAKDINPDMETGVVEVNCTSISVLNKCSHLPIPVNSISRPKEEARMRYRYIDLRSSIMQRNLRLRSSFLLNLRKYLCEEEGFVDVETPTLFRQTPGGAREFVVPTQKSGMFYSLPQSPQQFKQLLMVGGIDRYMQVAKCYRDEGAKPERQPEFTQLDLELSFTNQEEIKCLVEQMVERCWPNTLPVPTIPFPRLSYQEAMVRYGSDKPDTRFGSTIVDITDEMSTLPVFDVNTVNKKLAIKSINIKTGCERLKHKDIQEIQRLVQSQHSVEIAVVKLENSVWDSEDEKYLPNNNTQELLNSKMDASHSDLLFICAHESRQSVCEILGTCRQLVSLFCKNNGQPLYNSDRLFDFLWVEDFPLFERNDSRLQSTHHPFTAPLDEDAGLLYSDPAKVRGQHYDLVLNGCEIGGGSIRIHDANTQKYVLERILKEDTSQLEHLLQALDSGCPPHGGIALGLDRLLSIMCDTPTIRDVIAFPKSSDGTDLMTGAPCQLDAKDLHDYHVAVFKNEDE